MFTHIYIYNLTKLEHFIRLTLYTINYFLIIDINITMNINFIIIS